MSLDAAALLAPQTLVDVGTIVLGGLIVAIGARVAKGRKLAPVPVRSRAGRGARTRRAP